METKQETKSLPRNRKCGNCRYFEPAPLWRKGWCRNPRLYDRRANHLVDAATIDCEQVFRARIYWEPIPVSDPIEAEAVVVNDYREGRTNSGFAETPTADGGARIRPSTDGVLRPTPGRPPIVRREKAGATPNVVPKDSSARKWLLENIPYYDRVDGPLSRVRWKTWLPWIIVGLLLVVVLFNVLGKGNETKTDGTTTGSATTTLTASPSSSTTPGVAASNSVKPGTTGSPGPTATLSNALPTATPAPPTATPQPKVLAKVFNTQGRGVKMRKDPHITSGNEPSNVVTTIPEGAEVEITGAFKTAEGINWWPVSYKGQIGWAAQEYLQKKE